MTENSNPSVPVKLITWMDYHDATGSEFFFIDFRLLREPLEPKFATTTALQLYVEELKRIDDLNTTRSLTSTVLMQRMMRKLYEKIGGHHGKLRRGGWIQRNSSGSKPQSMQRSFYEKEWFKESKQLCR